MVVACLVKEIQICTELRKMAEMGLIQSEVVRIQRKIVSKPALFCQQAEDLVKQKFEFPLPNVEDQDDPLMKGEFMVMLELMQELPGAKEGKEKVNSFRQGQGLFNSIVVQYFHVNVPVTRTNDIFI